MDWLHQDDYLEYAKLLPLGGDKRIGHFCGEGDVLKIAHTPKGFTAYCFRCGGKGFTPIERKKLSDFDILKQQEAAAELQVKMELPNDFTQDIPPQHAIWLYKAGIGVDRIRSSGFGYSERLGRVVLPVYDDHGHLVYIQARATQFPEQQPKYLNIKGAQKDAIIYSSKPDNPVLESTVVLTEDILSANRVGEVQHSYSIMGTKLSDGQALKISAYDCAIWWLDGDDAGITGARKGSMGLQFYVGHQRIIRTPKDPKAYSKRWIRSILLSREYDISLR
ncbi:DNA primase [Vibrio phage 526E57-1]